MKDSRELIMILLPNSSTEELWYMYENGEWNDTAKQCFVDELDKRASAKG